MRFCRSAAAGRPPQAPRWTGCDVRARMQTETVVPEMKENTMSARNPIDEGPLRSSAERLRQELDRWMDAAWTQGERAIDAIGLRTERPSGPLVDIVERTESILVLINVPGLNPDQIQLTLAGNMLTVQGNFPLTAAGESGEVKLSERPQGHFRRSIPLPVAVDPESISAECRLGVLEVTITKSAQEKTHHIPVRSSDQSPAPPPAI
ncbi:MAG: Hsp20/alpha crystallin family protein [Planctomycetota bacterium]|nr:MAG: Hsp20/alpha crystallin family protein [Planctomycetota bacterium]REK23271.1 MAG: Hsp20/alpha crystallin family protein [Planctomycetota bacterium]REK30807.1 MAG: Hsp20/alpha crystallin family protein [Planctomycetota bacterium]